MKTEKSNVIVTRPIAMHTTTGPILATTTNIKVSHSIALKYFPYMKEPKYCKTTNAF